MRLALAHSGGALDRLASQERFRGVAGSDRSPGSPRRDAVAEAALLRPSDGPLDLPQHLAGRLADRPVLIDADTERDGGLVFHAGLDVLRQLRSRVAWRLDVGIRSDVKPGVIEPNGTMRLQP